MPSQTRALAHPGEQNEAARTGIYLWSEARPAQGSGPDRSQRMLFTAKGTQRIGARRATRSGQDSDGTNNHQHRCCQADVDGIKTTRREHHVLRGSPERGDPSTVLKPVQGRIEGAVLDL
jgi:hypothetical protein